MKKQIIIAKLFDSGGSNQYLKTLLAYIGAENVIVVLEDEAQIDLLNRLGNRPLITRVIKLYPYAHLKYKFTTNVKQLLFLFHSLFKIFSLSISNGFAPITISVVDPEKHLYLFWLPIIKVYYVLHSEPLNVYNPDTTKTCNLRLGEKKKIITVSNSMKQLICNNWRINANKIQFVKVIYNCVLFNSVDNEKPALKTADEKIILTIGHADSRKNPFIWVSVAQNMCELNKKAKFIWLGNGEYLSQLKQQTLNYNRIEFVGLIEDPRPYFESASIYYQPSLIEPQGIAVIEAMAHQLPCVVSNIGGLPESIQNEYSGLLVDPENVEEHVKAIMHLLDNPGLSFQYGKNAYNKYKETFTYETFKSNMDTIYRN